LYPPTRLSPALRVPGEWEPRDAVLLAWPAYDSATRGLQATLVALFTDLVSRLREHEPVRLLVPPDERATIARLLGGEGESLRLEPLLTNDIWMRDAGPISAFRDDGQPVFLDANFNGWGNRHPHELDRLIPTLLARRWGIKRLRLEICLEGGAVESNGAGDLVTTESVLLNRNRGNPARIEVEARLRQYFGAQRVHWLPAGLAGDPTDGHVDNLARFVAPDRIVYVRSTRADHPDSAVLEHSHAILSAMHTAGGRPELIELPAADVVDANGCRLPASYANFHLSPGLVLVPTFGHNDDAVAIAVMKATLPQHRVEGFDARVLLNLGGTLHCMTQPLSMTRRESPA
jgi:agmatine deiminase